MPNRTNEHLYQSDATILTQLIAADDNRPSRPQYLGRLIRAEKRRRDKQAKSPESSK